MMMPLLNKPFFLSHQQSAHGNRLTTNEAKDGMRSWFDKKKSSRSLFFLSFTSLRWERKSFMFALDSVDQKKVENVLSNEAMSTNTFDTLETESFSTESWACGRRDPNHDGDTKRPEFYERICRFPSLHSAFRCPLKQLARDIRGWEKVLSSSPIEPRKHERVLDGEKPFQARRVESTFQEASGHVQWMESPLSNAN